ncbi:hypothetical protein GGR56DRAFT_71041 [Xylariaceae sp. FL0804]|nr:hypothetical protein GGR56DRAFT_71041 [Xylariaceae sp. FL0804]
MGGWCRISSANARSVHQPWLLLPDMIAMRATRMRGCEVDVDERLEFCGCDVGQIVLLARAHELDHAVDGVGVRGGPAAVHCDLRRVDDQNHRHDVHCLGRGRDLAVLHAVGDQLARPLVHGCGDAWLPGSTRRIRRRCWSRTRSHEYISAPRLVAGRERPHRLRPFLRRCSYPPSSARTRRPTPSLIVVAHERITPVSPSMRAGIAAPTAVASSS